MASDSVPSLYPVAINLSCEDHGLLLRMTVTSLAAQTQWVKFYTDRHRGETACSKSVHVTVPT